MAGIELNWELLGATFISRVLVTILAAGRGSSDFDCLSHCNVIESVYHLYFISGILSKPQYSM